MNLILQMFILIININNNIFANGLRLIYIYKPIIHIKPRIPLVKMDYSQYKSFDDVINILPEFHTRIITNNWLKYVSPEEFDDPFKTRDPDNETDYINNDKIQQPYSEHTYKEFPEFLVRALYDFKIYIAINQQQKNNIYLAWCPDAKMKRAELAYIIAGKVINSTIYIERIAQNPYYPDILSIDSRELVKRLEDIEYKNGERFQFNYDRLHEYDPRYNMSWSF